MRMPVRVGNPNGGAQCKLVRYMHKVVIVLLIVLASCRGGDPAGFVLHPTPDNIQQVSDPRFVLHEDTSVQWFDVSSLEGVFVGVEEGEPSETIGQVWGLDISKNALLYADFMYGHVREYDLDGNLTEVVGKRGQGPGEFPRVRFVDVAGTSKDSYLVVGASEKRIVVFKDEDGVWVLFSSFETPHWLHNGALCTMDRHIYSIGYLEEYAGVVHKQTLEGEYVLSFGNHYSDPEPIIRDIIGGSGSLDCNEEHGVIAYANRLSSVVTGFSDRGDIRWQVQLADVNPMPAAQTRTEDGRASIQMRYTGGELDYGGSEEHTGHIRFIPGPDPESFFMTYYSPVPGKAEGWDKQHIFSIEAASGYGSYLGWHAILKEGKRQPYLKGFDSLRVYTSRSEPYPQIGIYRRPDVLP